MTAPVPAAGMLAGGIHELPMRVYYEDTDAAGIVYYANYLRFLERGRTEFVRACGLEQAELHRDSGLVFAVRRCEIDYLTPARLDDAVVVRTWIAELGRARILMGQEVRRDRDVLATARVTLACLDAAGRPQRLPALALALPVPTQMPP